MKHRIGSLLCVFLNALIFFISPLLAVPPEYAEALKLYRSGQYDQSLELIRSVFDANRGSLELRMLAAANHHRLGNRDSAMAHMMYAMKEHPDQPGPGLYLAALQREKGDTARALELMRRTAGRFPDEHWVRYELAATFFELKKYADARRQLEAIIAKNPNFFPAIYLDGLIYLVEGSYETADFRFKNALRIKMIDKEWTKRLYNNLGIVNEKLAETNPAQKEEKLNLARQYYRKALQLDGEYAIAKSNLERIQ